jgi:hypothetical protein
LAQVIAAFCDRMQRDAITGPVDARLARRDGAAWTAGPLRRISSENVISRPPLPASRLKMLAQTPLGTEAG